MTAFRTVFRCAIPSGVKGRPRLVAWPAILIGQVIKHRCCRRLVAIERRIVQGSRSLIQDIITSSQGSNGVLNTAYIERLNATFRSALTCLVRRTRALARKVETIEAGVYSASGIGCVYNLCTWHRSLRLVLYLTPIRRRWVNRTPAMAAGLTDHQWIPQAELELLQYKVPPPVYVPPKRRGRRPKTDIISQSP